MYQFVHTYIHEKLPLNLYCEMNYLTTHNCDLKHVNLRVILGQLTFKKKIRVYHRVTIEQGTICSRSSYPFCIVTYFIKWATTSWTYSTCAQISELLFNIGKHG